MSKLLTPALFLIALGLSTNIQANTLPELQIPTINVVDKFGVNMATGQISLSIKTLSIGGPMGLSHSISGFTNTFSFSNYKGYHDQYNASVKYAPMPVGTQLGGVTYNTEGSVPYTLRISDFSETVEFLPLINGQLVRYITNEPLQTVKFVALKDTRHTLAIDKDNSLIWTKPDGTEVKYLRSKDGSAVAEGTLQYVISPNGFAIAIDPVNGNVYTNTGFQLLYEKAGHGYIMDKAEPGGDTLEGVANLTPDIWSTNPTRVMGINAAVEYCTDVAKCNESNKWPTAKFTWPSGMPRTLYVNYPISAEHPTEESGVFSIKNAQGQTTELHFQAQSLAVDKCNQLGELNTIDKDLLRPPRIVPRLVGIKTAESKVVNLRYEYCNELQPVERYENGTGFALASTLLVVSSSLGKIKTAQKNNDSNSYEFFQKDTGDRVRNTSKYGDILSVISWRRYNGNLYTIASNAVSGVNYNSTGENVFDNSWPNNPLIVNSGNGYNMRYCYDGEIDPNQQLQAFYNCRMANVTPNVRKGNLRAACKVNGTNSSMFICSTADYPLECNNRKTCNQPIWTSDYKQNKTYYQYHAESGQPERITYPANEQGVAPVTRFHYSQFKAKYYKNNASNKEEGSPIWLKDSEKTCNKTATGTDGCAGGDKDEVVKTFEYNHDNLFLTGMTVKAFDPIINDFITKRTCYQYDIYGNKTAETQPKANLKSCS